MMLLRLWVPMPIPLDDLNAKIFREQLHSQFKVHQDNAAPITA